MRKVRVVVSEVDDGVSILLNDEQMHHINFLDSRTYSFYAENGDIVTFQIWNKTGGAWNANIKLYVGRNRRLSRNYNGWSGVVLEPVKIVRKGIS